MTRTLMGVLAGLMVWSGQALASVGYTKEGKVVLESPYTGPGLGMADLGFLGTTVGGVAAVLNVQEVAVQAIAPLSFVIWGVWRTALYRPSDVKQQIREALSRQSQMPRPGSIQELLAQ